MPGDLQISGGVAEEARNGHATKSPAQSVAASSGSGGGLSTSPKRPRPSRKVLDFYLLQLTRVWTHLPEAFRRRSVGRAFGRHLHRIVCLLSERQQYVATFFLRNRPELDLMCNLLGVKVPGSTVSLCVVACSKGAEVYSIAWAIRSARPDLQFRIQALDIAPEIVEFAERGIYSRQKPEPGVGTLTDTSESDRVAWTTHRDQGASIFERVSEAELEEMCEIEGDRSSIRSWLRKGITWLHGDAGDPVLVAQLGLQDIVVANRFLCHMQPADAERCLRNVARLVKPGGYLFVTGIDLDVRTKVAQSLGWKPVQELIREIHEGDSSLRDGWPLGYWALEPFRDDRPDWGIRYASVFQIGETASIDE